MKILIAYFSRTGYTEKLAWSIADRLTAERHSIEWEVVKPTVYYSWLREVARDWPRYPSMGLSLLSKLWREHHIRTYNQVEEDIQALDFPNVSGFDRICIGGPKWAQISYPLARYLQTIRGIRGKKVGAFATFGGPPLKAFEIDLIQKPLTQLLNRMGAEIIANVYVTSAYHEASLMPMFKLASLMRYGRNINHFKLGSEYAEIRVQNFCDDLLKEDNGGSADA